MAIIDNQHRILNVGWIDLSLCKGLLLAPDRMDFGLYCQLYLYNVD